MRDEVSYPYKIDKGIEELICIIIQNVSLLHDIFYRVVFGYQNNGENVSYEYVPWGPSLKSCNY
jgi:hypothetical protein